MCHYLPGGILPTSAHNSLHSTLTYRYYAHTRNKILQHARALSMRLSLLKTLCCPVPVQVAAVAVADHRWRSSCASTPARRIGIEICHSFAMLAVAGPWPRPHRRWYSSYLSSLYVSDCCCCCYSGRPLSILG